MSTKRELERNEKVIRGLMKLPPNRRCINCNSLGPQYVCTNFWTFVCMICSGIHREFTHRVKSVSMSKFTSQEVESLQNGGNQRAREIFLKDWDRDRQRQPNSSNVDKVREFIKAVYVDRQYASGNNSEKPPRNLQSQRNVGDETRRASSYHSFSQSPPYDFQYEDWLIRKHKGSINRKPASDLNIYDRKVASSIYSPGRLSEDRFANERSSSLVSDYSFSSGDPFKSEPQSPNLQKDDGFSSPTSDSSREIYDGLHHQTPSTYSETYAKVDKAPLRQPQRTVSLGSVGSFEKSSVSLYSEFNHSTVTTQNKAFGTPPPMPVRHSGEINLFEDAMVMSVPHSASGVDLFQGQKPGSVASMDLFHKLADSSTFSQDYPSNFCSSSTICQNPPTPDSNQKIWEPSEPSNEGWATFDLPQTSLPSHKTLSNFGSKAELEHPVGSFGPSVGGLQWPKSQNLHIHSPPVLVSNPWSEDLQNAHVATNMSSSQIWKPFDEANEHHQCNDTHLQASVGNASSNIDLFASFRTQEDFDVDGLQQIASTTEGFSFQTLPSNVSSGSSFVEPRHPFMSDMLKQNSGNPFDMLFDSKSEVHDTFLDIGTLRTALSSAPLPSSYMGNTKKPWFPGNAVTSPGGMPYTIPEARSSQLQNVPTQGPVASYGGNPFA